MRLCVSNRERERKFEKTIKKYRKSEIQSERLWVLVGMAERET